MGTQPKKPKDKKKVPKKGVADAERLQNLLNQVSKAQKPVRPATGRTDKKESGRRNGDPQVEAARRPPSNRPSSSAFKRLVQRPGKEGQESAARVASEQEDVEEEDGDGDGTDSDEEEEDVGEVGQEQPGDESGSEEETEEDTSAKPAPPAKRVKLEQMMVSTSKGKSKREPIDLTVDALQLKRYCIDAVKMFIAEKIVALDELWSAEVVKRKEVYKEIRRLAEYCGVMPSIVDKKMKTHFYGL